MAVFLCFDTLHMACCRRMCLPRCTPVNVYLAKSALTFAEGFEMLIDVLPFGVPGIGFFLEPCEEAAFLLLPVKEVIAFVHDALIASAAQCLGFLRHGIVVITLALVLGLGKDVDAK